MKLGRAAAIRWTLVFGVDIISTDVYYAIETFFPQEKRSENAIFLES
jgi:hypothetical protein